MNITYRKLFLFFLLCTFYLNGAYALDVGDRLPAINLPLLNHPNKTIAVHTLPAKYLYLDFWASWCIPCRVSLPKLNSIAVKLEQKGLRIVTINLDKKRKNAVRFLQQYPVSFLVLSDTKGISAEQFNLPKMPSAFLIKDGKIIKTFFGYSGNEVSQLQSLVQ